jgi:hypothetical protein
LGGIPATRLQVRAEGKQPAIAILHHKLTRVPWHVGKSPREFHASRCILSVKRVRIFDEYVRVEQFVRILVGIGCGRFGAAEVNRLLVARNDGVNWRVLPRTQTLEAKLSFVIGKGAGDVQGEELRRDLTNHGASLLQKMLGGVDRGSPAVLLLWFVRTAFWQLVNLRGGIVGKLEGIFGVWFARNAGKSIKA